MKQNDMPQGIKIIVYIDVDTGNSNKRIYIHECSFIEDYTFMLAMCGLYPLLWSWEQERFIYADDLITPLKLSLKEMNKDPKKYIKMDRDGWMLNYEHFRWRVEELLNSCETHYKCRLHFSLYRKVNKWGNHQHHIDHELKILEDILEYRRYEKDKC